jgi:hypothetical protein
MTTCKNWIFVGEDMRSAVVCQSDFMGPFYGASNRFEAGEDLVGADQSRWFPEVFLQVFYHSGDSE